MVNIKSYKDIKVELIDKPSSPLETIALSTQINMKKDFKGREASKELVKYLLDANHTSPFEHLNYQFLIEGASRSFLAQQTRHRMASYSSASQHYQDYTDYGFTVNEEMSKNPQVKEYFEKVTELYKTLMSQGIPNYEARQILPNASENNLMITMNARSLINYFNLRLCNRNTDEIKIVANKMYNLVQPNFPELWDYVGPDCIMSQCKQGKRGCNKWKIKKS